MWGALGGRMTGWMKNELHERSTRDRKFVEVFPGQVGRRSDNRHTLRSEVKRLQNKVAQGPPLDLHRH